MNRSLNITRCFGQALKLYRKRWAPMLGIALLLFALPTAALTMAVLFTPEDETTLAILLLVFLFLNVTGSFWYRSLTTHVVWSEREGEEAPIGALVKRTFEGFPRISTVGFLVWVGTVGGLLLLIVPGIIFGTRRSPAMSAAVVEGKGAFQGRGFRDPEFSAMRRSRDLVKDSGNSFEVFAVIAAKTVVYATFASLLPALNVIAIPWGSLATSMVYFELVEIEKLGPAAPSGQGTAQALGLPAQAPALPAHDSDWRPRPEQGSGPAA